MFQVKEDTRIMNQIHFTDTSFLPRTLELYKENFYKLPDTVAFSVQMGEFTPFPDIILSPCPLVSEMVMKVMQMYRVEFFYRRAILVERKSLESEPYYLLDLEQEAERLYRDFVLKELDDSVQCFLSLDFAESILRRGAKGIILKEIKEMKTDERTADKTGTV